MKCVKMIPVSQNKNKKQPKKEIQKDAFDMTLHL